MCYVHVWSFDRQIVKPNKKHNCELGLYRVDKRGSNVKDDRQRCKFKLSLVFVKLGQILFFR